MLNNALKVLVPTLPYPADEDEEEGGRKKERVRHHF